MRVGVQFHPERTDPQHPDGLALIERIVSLIGKRRSNLCKTNESAYSSIQTLAERYALEADGCNDRHSI